MSNFINIDSRLRFNNKHIIETILILSTGLIITSIWSFNIYHTKGRENNGIYPDTNYRNIYITTLSIRFIWNICAFPIMKEDYDEYMDHSINEIRRSVYTIFIYQYIYYFLNTVFGLVMDSLIIYYQRDTNVYKIYGPITACLLLYPIVIRLLSILIHGFYSLFEGLCCPKLEYKTGIFSL